ncbi:MAG: TonB-dependent receptor [bacterium]|nr:TonB-dependent receptor [bacterium]
MRFFNLILCCFVFLPEKGFCGPCPKVIIYPLPKKNTPSQRLIKKEEIQQFQLQSLKSALSHATGSSTDSSGDNGRRSVVSIRGGRAKHTLVLLDGIPLNSPESQNEVDFGGLNSYSFDTILVEKGSQSVRYGPQAMGGVIHLSTLCDTPPSDSPSLLFHGEAGNDHTLRGHTKIQHTFEKGAFQLSTGAHTQGDGSFINKKHGNKQADDFSGHEGIFSLRLNPTSHARITMTSFWQQNRLLFDNGSAVLPIISDQTQETRRLALGLTGQFDSPNHNWTHKVQALYFRGQFQISESPFPFLARGRNLVARYELSGMIAPNHTLTTGFEWRSQTLDVSNRERSLNSGGLYAIYELKPFEHFTLDLGVRHDHPKDFQSITTWHAKGKYGFSQKTSFYGGLSTGYRAPSAEDILGGPKAIPNPDIKPEHSLHADLGLTHQFTPETGATVGLFYLSLQDFISGVTIRTDVSQAQNSGKRHSYGAELSLTHRIGALTLEGNYTLTLARDSADNNHQPRRLPRHSGGITAKYAFNQEKGLLFGQLSYTSSTRDHIFSLGQNVTLPEIWRLRLGGHYQITSRTKLFGRVENALNRSFENAFGFGHKGRTLYLGLEVKL